MSRHRETIALWRWLGESPRVAWIVLFICLCITLAWWKLATHESEQRAQQHFGRRIGEITKLIEERLSDYGQLLIGAKGIFSALDNVDQSQWRDYVASQGLRHRYPGARALAFAKYVTAAGKNGFVRQLRAGGIRDFKIKPGGTRPEYAPVVFGAGISAHPPHVIGLDLLADPQRSGALLQARDSGKITGTNRLILARDPGRPPVIGFILYAPVYRRGVPHANISERRHAFLGVVVCPIVVSDLMNNVIEPSYSDMDLEIFDGSKYLEATQLYDADLADRIFGSDFRSQFSSRTSLNVYGRTWSLLFSSLPNFEASVEARQPRLILGFGLVGSLMLFSLIWSLSRTKTRALWLAERMTVAFKESEKKYSSLMEQASDAILVADREGKYIDVNLSACELLGYTESELLALHMRDLLLPEEIALEPLCLENLHLGESVIKERQLRRKDGSLVQGEISAKLLEDGRLQEIIRDISERKRAEEKLKLAAAVFEIAAEGITITDKDNRIISINPAFTRITEYDENDTKGLDPKVLASGMHDAEFYRTMWRTLASDGKWQGEIVNRKKNGEIYNEWLSINAIKDAKGNVVNYVAIFSDITERKTTEARMRYLAHHDPLTGLPNRSLLRDRLEQAIKRAKRESKKLAVMFLDLNKFKQINDTLGHKIGDEVLQEAANRLKRCVRDSDTVARLGGDEFVVLLQDVQSGDDAQGIAAKIRQRFAEPFHIQGHHFAMSTSIGVARYPDDGDDDESLLQHADLAMYRTKGNRDGETPMSEEDIAAADS